MDIRGKNAILTGASAGIGLGILRSLATAGVNLAITARQAAPLESAAEEAASAGVDVFTFAADITDFSLSLIHI